MPILMLLAFMGFKTRKHGRRWLAIHGRQKSRRVV